MNLITPYSNSRTFIPTWPVAAALLGFVSILAGCNSRAHKEVYRQRMANEIRVLEDQLYDADYQNRVLQDKLNRYNDQVKASRIPTPDEIGTSPRSHHYQPVPSADLIDPNPISFDAGIPVPVPDANADNFEIGAPQFGGQQPDPLGAGLETELPKPTKNATKPEAFDPNDFDPSMFDSGEAVSPEDVAAPLPDSKSNDLKSELQVPKPLKDPGQQEPLKDLPSRRPQFERLPPPVGISPPGKNDTQFSPIIPGDIEPPSADSGDEKPPGQILLPNSTQTQTGVPEDLRIHPALSVGHRDGQKLDGATLVVTALDRLGRALNLNDFEVDAELSVVVLDPDRKPGENRTEHRLGRWDFSRKEVAAMIAGDKNGGLEIPIRFEDETPLTDKVIVHVRLRGDDQEMRTQANLDLRERTAASTWTPRGE